MNDARKQSIFKELTKMENAARRNPALAAAMARAAKAAQGFNAHLRENGFDKAVDQAETLLAEFKATR